MNLLLPEDESIVEIPLSLFESSDNSGESEEVLMNETKRVRIKREQVESV